MNAFRPSRCESIEINGISCSVRHWGPAEAPSLFLLHGWMDASASFQFVVDALVQEWHVIAPDWRGYGNSDWLRRPYWSPDYLVELDALLARYSPDQPARLVGHSMGAGIAALYAGTRPQRVAQLAMLDFLGLPAASADAAPERFAAWIAEARDEPRLRVYRDHAALARRLQSVNPRLLPQRADFLAREVGRRLADGQVQMACDPWHKLASPVLYRVEEAMACWRAIRAPVLMVIADRGIVEQRFGKSPEERQRRLACFADLQVIEIGDSGHNLQHDQPEKVAAALEDFLRRH